MNSLVKKILKSSMSLLLICSMLFVDIIIVMPANAAGATTGSGSTVTITEKQEETPRDYDTLMESEGVILSEDGDAIIGVKETEDESFTPEEIDTMFGGAIDAVSEEEALASKEQHDSEGIQERFDLSQEEIEVGTELHGSMDEFQTELDSFDISNQNIDLATQTQEYILTLINSGYTNSQAFAACVASQVLGITIETLADVKAEEIKNSLADDNNPTAEAIEFDPTQDDSIAEENDDYYALATKMGVPYSVIDEYMETSLETCDELEIRFDAAKEKAYPIESQSENEETIVSATKNDLSMILVSYEIYTSKIKDNSTILALTSSSSSTFSYAPEDILTQPYSYDSDGTVDINLNTGEYSYEETDLSIPGVNGLDLNIVRRYDSAYSGNSSALAYLYDEYADTNTAEGKTAIGGVGYKPYLVEGTDANGNYILSEITSMSSYTLADSTILSGFSYSTPNYLLYFTASEYETAAYYKDSLDAIYALAYINGSTSNTAVIAFKPIIIGIEPYFSNACYNVAFTYDYYIDQYGLGQGWSLGFSAIETYLADIGCASKQRLITKDGQKYEIEFTSQSDDSNLVDYDLTDMRLENSGFGYAGASYTLFYKDGSKEYFDSNGRNIAIVDKYGNAITLGYTLTSSGEVSAITIVDTLGHEIIYANNNIDSSTASYIYNDQGNSRKYNVKWSLSLDGEVIKEYYSCDLGYWGIRILNAVSDECSHTTLYSSSNDRNNFNCFISTASTNDSYIVDVVLSGIVYPSGLRRSFTGNSTSNVKRLGYAGYEEYYQVGYYITSQYDSNGNENYLTYNQYDYGDFSALTSYTLAASGSNATYTAEIAKYQSKYLVGVGRYLWVANRDKYYFEYESQHKVKECLYANSAIQDSQVISQSTWYTLALAASESLTKQTTYSYNDNDLPIAVNNTYYNTGSTTAAMTENYAYTYDTKGNVLTATQPNGQVITYTYDSNYSIPLTQSNHQDASTTILVTNTLTSDGKDIALQSTTANSVLQSKTAFTYDSAGRLTNQKNYLDASNYVETQYVYGNNAQVTELITKGVKDADGNLVAGTTGYDAGVVVQKNAYNNRGWVTAQTDGEGNTTTIAYDATGRITQVTNPDSTYAGYVYDVANNTVTYTNEVGYALQYQYDPAGNLTGTYDVAGAQMLSSITYDSLNRPISQTVYSSGEDKITYYYYDTNNRLIETGTNNESGTLTSKETYSYSYENGTYKTTKTVLGDSNSPSQVTTSYQDNMGNVVKTGKLLDGTEYLDTYTYDYLGNPLTVKTAYTASLSGAYTNSYTYDYAGNVLSTTDALGHISYQAYDWLGRKISATDNSGNTTLYTYDALGQLLKQEQPFTSSGDTIYYATTKYSYDLNGNVVSQKTANNAPGETASWAQTDYEYNSRNQLAKVTAYDDGSAENYTQYYYDGVGNMLRMYTGLSSPLTISGLDSVSGTDTDYSVTKYAYNRFSQMISKTDALSQTESYTYDINGNMLTKTDRNENVTTYAYDNLGRLTSTSVVTPDGDGDESIAMTYTLTGLKLSESNSAATVIYAYDALGRLITETDGDAIKTYGYNIGGNRTVFNLTVNGTQQQLIGYSYDALNRLTGVAQGTITAAYGYDTNGNRSYMEYNNGLREDYTYNLSNLLTSLANTDDSGTVLSQYDYTYALDSNQLSKTDEEGNVTAYVYDDLGRLVSETETQSGTQSQSYTYTYDDNSNRASLTAAGDDTYTTIYVYDANNRLLTTTKTTSDSADTATYYYDPNGNQIAEVNESIATGTDPESYSLTNGVADSTLSRYNGFNQLVESTVGDMNVTYAYAPSGLRVSKTVDGTETEFVLDGDQVVLELVSDAVTAYYVRGINLIYSAIGSTTNYYLYNGHGDVVQLTDASGAVTKEYDYDAFGNEKEIDTADTNPFRYCGEYYDAETGTYYLRARYYDPVVGRFTQQDTYAGIINDPLSLNLYVYCGNNPIVFVDPSGHIREAGYYTINGVYGWYGDPDASEFGRDSDTYKILVDTGNRWMNTTDKTERERLHGIAEDARNLARAKTPYMFGNDIVMTTLHENAQTGLDYLYSISVNDWSYSYGGNPYSQAFGWLTGMHFKSGDNAKWDYKWDPNWQVPYDYFNGVDMNEYYPGDGSCPKNYTDWIYFNGQLMGADKVSNMNWGYVGTKMGYFGAMLFNPFTTGGGDDVYIQMGVDLANNGY